LFELPSSDLLAMDLKRWQAASAVQTALDINDHALSLERHNDGTRDVVFLSNPTVLLLLSFESMLTYETHESSTRDFRCQSVEPYWSQHNIPPFDHTAAITRQDVCLRFHRRTCSQWILIVDRQQPQYRQLSTSVIILYHWNVTMMLLMMLCFFQIQRYRCYCHSRACSRMKPMKAQLVISDATALSHIDNNTTSHNFLTRLQSQARTFVWASIVGLARNGYWSLTGTKRSTDSSRHQWSCFITRMSQWCYTWCCDSSKSNAFAASVIREHAHVWIPWKINSWFQMPERWAIMITTQHHTICSHVCNHSPGYLFELPSSDLLAMDLKRW